MKNPFTKLIHHYTYDMHLKIKFVMSHIILVPLPTAVLLGFLYLRVYGIVMDGSTRSKQALSAQTVTSIGSLVSRVGHASDIATGSMIIQDLFRVPRSGVSTRDISTSKMNSLFHLVQSITDHSMIVDMKVYYDDSARGDLTRHNRIGNTLLNPVPSASSSYWYDILNTSRQSRLLCPEPYLTPDETRKSGKLTHITRILCIYEGGTVSDIENTSAYMILYLSGLTFETVLRNDATVTNEIALPVNGWDVVVSASNVGLTGRYFIPRHDLEQWVGREKTFSLVSYLDGFAYVTYFPIVDTDWYVMFTIPALRIGDIGRVLMTHFAMVYLLLIALTLYTAFRPSDSIADRIIGAALRMETVRAGPPQPMDVVDTGCDGIGMLSGTYNYITEEIITLIDSQKKTSDKLRMAKSHVLQAQINPHFLYNTLDMIDWLSQTGQNEKVTEAIQILSHFYKLTLSRRELMNSIEKELEYISLYVCLQNIRYDNRAVFVVDVPEELCEYTIPKPVFQPTVEDAFLHGVMMKEEKRDNILLTGRPEGDDTVFIISGDGAGILPETLDVLKDDVNAGTGSSVNPKYTVFFGYIDIYNTDLGLKSLHGESYDLSITNTLGKGTEVTIRTPARYITSD